MRLGNPTHRHFRHNRVAPSWSQCRTLPASDAPTRLSSTGRQAVSVTNSKAPVGGHRRACWVGLHPEVGSLRLPRTGCSVLKQQAEIVAPSGQQFGRRVAELTSTASAQDYILSIPKHASILGLRSGCKG